MPRVIIGAPEKPKPEEREGFFITPNMNAFLDTTSNTEKVGIDFKDKTDKLLFHKDFANLHAAMTCINNMKAHYEKKGSTSNGNKPGNE